MYISIFGLCAKGEYASIVEQQTHFFFLSLCKEVFQWIALRHYVDLVHEPSYLEYPMGHYG